MRYILILVILFLITSVSVFGQIVNFNYGISHDQHQAEIDRLNRQLNQQQAEIRRLQTPPPPPPPPPSNLKPLNDPYRAINNASARGTEAANRYGVNPNVGRVLGGIAGAGAYLLTR